MTYDLPQRARIERYMNASYQLTAALGASMIRWGARRNIYRELPGAPRHMPLVHDMLRVLAAEGRASS